MRSLAHELGRRGWLVALVAMLAAFAAGFAGTPAPTPEDIAAACLSDMDDVNDITLDRMTTEYLRFVESFSVLPIDTPVPKAFKQFAAECKKLDAIERAGVSKLLKVSNKCLAKLAGVKADPQLITDVTVARDDYLESLALQLRQNYQKSAADRLSTFVQSN